MKLLAVLCMLPLSLLAQPAPLAPAALPTVPGAAPVSAGAPATVAAELPPGVAPGSFVAAQTLRGKLAFKPLAKDRDGGVEFSVGGVPLGMSMAITREMLLGMHGKDVEVVCTMKPMPVPDQSRPAQAGAPALPPPARCEVIGVKGL